MKHRGNGLAPVGPSWQVENQLGSCLHELFFKFHRALNRSIRLLDSGILILECETEVAFPFSIGYFTLTSFHF
jgi:hypothetical protein